jgi:putative DNA primase/helicase
VCSSWSGSGTNGHRVSDGTGHIESARLESSVNINEQEITTMSATPHRTKQQRTAAPSTAEQTLRSLDQAAPSVQTDKVPASLKEISNWVHWQRKLDDNGKPTKVPYVVGSAKKAGTDNPSSWGSFEKAVKSATNERGLGFVLPPSGKFFFVDLDHVINLQTGEITPWANRLVRELNSFAEISPSGTGVHIYGCVKGAVPPEGIKKGSIEFYTMGRYTTVTGNHLSFTPSDLREVDVTWLYKLLQSDVFTFHKDAKYEALFNNVDEGWTALGYASQSEADMALCGFLAIRLGSIPDDIDRAYRLSGLMRDKWDDRRANSTYGRDTILKVVQLGAHSYQDTDLGNAERFVAQHGADIRFSHSSNEWLLWDGTRYAIDKTGGIERKAKEFAKSSYFQAAKSNLQGSASLLWGRTSMSRNHINSVIHFARTEPGIPVTADQLDADRWLFNCRNGTIDLRSGKLGEHRRHDLITRLAPVEYHPNAKCPRWEEYLHRVMSGNIELIGFLQRAVGYSLTGETKEHALFIPYGTGKNGKTTFVETVRKIFGDYVKVAEANLLLQRRSEGPRNDIARLAGARLVLTSETGAGGKLDEALVKRLTGGDTMIARFLYQEFEEFYPSAKFWLTTNNKPQIQGRDLAIWRRIKLIPFQVTIPDHEQDKDLGQKFVVELSGILAWAVKGCLEWQRVGLRPPAEVLAATKEYEQESDELREFLEDCCVVEKTNQSRTVFNSRLFKAWQNHCERNGQKGSWSSAYFGKQLSKRDFGFDKINGQRCRTGISLKSQALPTLDKTKWPTSGGATPLTDKPPHKNGSAAKSKKAAGVRR